jgi:hypothetical protein
MEQDNLEDLESCPSGVGASSELDVLNVDQITNELLNQILQEFAMDPHVKL